MVVNALNSGAKTFMADFEGGKLKIISACWRADLFGVQRL
jgi:malate synthase